MRLAITAVLAAAAAVFIAVPVWGQDSSGGLESEAVVFDFQQPGTTSPSKPAVIKNGSGAAVTVSRVDIRGRNPRDFVITNDACSGVAIQPGADCRVNVAFRPTEQSTRVASLVLTHNGDCAHYVTLAGSGSQDNDSSGPSARARAAACNPPSGTAPSGGSGSSGPSGSQTSPSGAIALPRTCTSRRRFRIHLRAPRNQRLRSARVTIGGKRISTRSVRGRLTATIDLRGRKGRGTVRVRVSVRTSSGRTITSSRTYRTCVPARG